MKIILILAALMFVGCAAPGRDCPPLPLLPDNPTPAHRQMWTDTIAFMYVRCAKGSK